MLARIVAGGPFGERFQKPASQNTTWGRCLRGSFVDWLVGCREGGRDRELFSFFFFPSRLFSSPFFFSIPPSHKSDSGPNSRIFSPFPTAVCALHFYREKIAALTSLADARRDVRTHATKCFQRLIPFLVCNVKLSIDNHVLGLAHKKKHIINEI